MAGLLALPAVEMSAGYRAPFSAEISPISSI